MNRAKTFYFDLSGPEDARKIEKALRKAGLDGHADKFSRRANFLYRGKMTNGIQCSKEWKTHKRYVRWSKTPDYNGEYRFEVCRLIKGPIPMNEIEQTHDGYGRRKDAAAAAEKYALSH